MTRASAEAPVKVKNINGTSQNSCPCGSWLNHWKKMSGKAAYYCSVTDCHESVEVGAHVQKDGGTDASWYIVPMCKKHNAKAPSLNIRDDVQLVPANVSKTCGTS